jgi:hypothetical protein
MMNDEMDVFPGLAIGAIHNTTLGSADFPILSVDYYRTLKRLKR